MLLKYILLVVSVILISITTSVLTQIYLSKKVTVETASKVSPKVIGTCSDTYVLNLKTRIMSSGILGTSPLSDEMEILMDDPCLPTSLIEFYKTKVTPQQQCLTQNNQKLIEWRKEYFAKNPTMQAYVDKTGANPPEDVAFQQSLPRCDQKVYNLFSQEIKKFLQS